MEEEIRKKAIMSYIVEKEKPKVIYTSLNRSKKWFFKWLKRYETGGRDWYKEQSRAPLRSPNEISQGKKDFIISTRQHLESEPYAQIGVSAIKWELTKLGMTFPSDRTIHRVLKREGLVKKNCLCSQGDRVSILYRSSRGKQYPPNGSSGASVYQGGWKVLRPEHNGSLQPSGVFGISKNQRG
jgi:hypothetical protein